MAEAHTPGPIETCTWCTTMARGEPYSPTLYMLHHIADPPPAVRAQLDQWAAEYRDRLAGWARTGQAPAMGQWVEHARVPGLGGYVQTPTDLEIGLMQPYPSPWFVVEWPGGARMVAKPSHVRWQPVVG